MSAPMQGQAAGLGLPGTEAGTGDPSLAGVPVGTGDPAQAAQVEFLSALFTAAEQERANTAANRPRRRRALRRVGKKEIEKAESVLKEYKQGKANLEARIVSNEQWYKLRHWEQIRGKKYRDDDPYPASAWLFNSIANKHADAMDNFPEPSVLPREEGDKDEAAALSSILPVILEENDFEQTYSDVWWYKLKTGTGVYGVFWNPRKHNGLGDIDIRGIDLLNLFWEPGIKDIQQSQNLFHVELMDNELLEQLYPQLKNQLGGNTIDVTQYIYDDSIDTSKKTAVVDWYYKQFVDGRQVLHYCKFCSGKVLYASENDPEYALRGFYDHGKYPFVFDVMYVEEGTPAGFGLIDVMKDVQMYIDKLNQLIVKNALMATKKRFFIRDDGSINEKEFADWDKDFIHVAGGGLGEDSIRELTTQPLSSIYLQIMQLKIEELKEVSGNRDFSQGGTSSGVTAASAIAALQEAGSKLSRDMIKSAYRSFARINTLCVELIRQFYDEPRSFRILGEQNRQQFTSYDNTGLKPQPQGAPFGVGVGYRVPEFDIQIVSQKASPFSKISQNELAKELYGLGFFNPQMAAQALVCVDMMDFDGKDLVMQKISRNGSLLEALMQMQQQMQQMAALLSGGMGGAPGGNAMPGAQQNNVMAGQDTPRPEEMEEAVREGAAANRPVQEPSITRNARARTAQATIPRP